MLKNKIKLLIMILSCLFLRKMRFLYSFLYKFTSKIIDIINNFRYVFYRNKFEIDESFRFNGKDIYFYGEGALIILEDSYIGSFSTIQIDKNSSVHIGKGCSISHNVRMYTTSWYPDADFSKKENIDIKVGDIIIGDYVWIGANVFINPGVKIGSNSVIGANSVITKDIEPDSIYGGVPAKLIRKKNYV